MAANKRVNIKSSTSVFILIMAVLFAAVSCTKFSLSDEFTVTPTETPLLKISPSSAALSVWAVLKFSASGGFPPYAFEITSGEGAIDGETGSFTAPGSPGSAVVTVRDTAGGESSADVIIVADAVDPLLPRISPTSAALTVGSAITFSVSGGTPPYVFVILSGEGTIDGASGYYIAPNIPGTAVVAVRDAAGAESSAEITILALSPNLRLFPIAPVVQIGLTVNFIATGGTLPYTYSVAAGGAGGTINPAGGVYTAPTTPGIDIVQVTDFLSGSDEVEVTIVPASQLLISPASITIGADSSYQFSAVGGLAPYVFSLYSGGGSVTPAGLYTAPGTNGTAFVRVTDNAGAWSDATVTVVMAGGPLSITPMNPSVGENQVIYFAGAGGTPPYLFSVISGSGTIVPSSGVYTAIGVVGSPAATVRLTDSASGSITTTVTILPAAPSNLTATPNPPNSVVLTWTDNTSSEDSYILERKTEISGTYGIRATLPANTTGYTDTGSPNVLYVYRVYAKSGSLDSPYSAEVFTFTNK